MNTGYINFIRRYDQFTEEHGISGSALKIIAVITMLIDHIAYYFLEGTAVFWPMRYIGRISFIIYAFLIAEGIKHTSDIIRYTLRLLALAIICQIPYNLFRYGDILTLKFNNIFVSFVFAILPFIFWKKVNGNKGKLLAVIFAGISVVAAYFLKFEYNFFGLGLIWCLAFSNKKNIIPIVLFLSMICIIYHWGKFQMYEIMAFPLILFYNGERGFIKTKVMKYAFYVVYPLQFLIMWLIGQMLVK